jgi:hypothetical protein
MVSARRESGAAPFMGQDALLRLAKSQQSMLTAGGRRPRPRPSQRDCGGDRRWQRWLPGQCEPR